ncbi:hypothetical protein LG329_05645 [Virgibacillus necropolis]|uniref:hypothetical protein n=1 Tax=Virgibacillus necropolis TaxID=163877 RepID=UPI00384F8BC6
MGKSKKNNAMPPRHKRLNRKERLQAAPHWIEKNLVHSYSNHFGVDKLCAVNELEILGYSNSEEYSLKLQNALIQKQKQNEKRKAAKRQNNIEFLEDESDETYAFIAGYTSGGAPFGIKWEEWEQDEDNPNSKKGNVPTIDEDDLPF